MDQISAKFLRDGAEVLAPPLGKIIILLIKLSTFPEESKITKLKPMFKEGATTDPINYRPISFLPLVSKIIEKPIHFVATGMDKQMHTGMILIDLQKAFDTLDHGVILEKMKYFGFRESVIKWFESYLSNRKFLVCIDNVFSEAGTLKYGVPQGSILGSLHFLLYVKDLPQSLSEAGSYLNADDTCIFYQHEDFKKIENVLNKEFS